MTNRPLFEPDPWEPLSVFMREEPASPGAQELRELRLEYSSRGDRVPAKLLLPQGAEGPHPLVIVQDGEGSGRDAANMRAVCGTWVRSGAAVVSIDLPLQGGRASAKLTERISTMLRSEGSPSPFDAELWINFVRQGVVDLRRAFDVMATHPAIDVDRAAYVGFNLGAIVGAPFCAEEKRVRAAVLAAGGGGFGPVAVDPIGHIGRIAPRPVLLVNAKRDETIPRERADALEEAAEEPKEVLWLDCTHSAIPARAQQPISTFLDRHLA